MLEVKFKNGDTVNTKYGVFELLQKCSDGTWLGYQNWFDGHSGCASFGDTYKYSKYKGQCWWFEESEIEIVENDVKSTKKSYREMSPDSTVKVKISDYEFDCPIKELLIVDAISGNIVGHPRTSVFFDNIEKALDTEHLDLYWLISNVVKVTNAEDFYEEYFKPFYDNQHEVEALKKEIEHQEALLLDMKKKLSEIS